VITGKALSMYQKRQAELAEQIKALEVENIGPKDWTVMGEATSRARPKNSLLEEDLEFERAAKAVPVITETTTKTLEDRIKARILEVSVDMMYRLEISLSSFRFLNRIGLTTSYGNAPLMKNLSCHRVSLNSRTRNHLGRLLRSTRMNIPRLTLMLRVCHEGMIATGSLQRSTMKLIICGEPSATNWMH
jgi:Mpp10 protein